MRILYAALVLVLVSNFAAYAQIQPLVLLHDEQGNLVNGTLISGDCEWSTDTVSLLSTLNPGTSATTINVRRHELWPVSGSKNFYCWGVCYLPANAGSFPTWVSNDPVAMEPGVEVSNFHAYYQPYGSTETTLFRFVWYDLANPFSADTSWVDIMFCGQVGIEEEVLTTSLSLWPTPTTGQDVQVDFTLDRTAIGSQLVVYNALGAPVRRLALNGRDGRTTISVGDLVPGVYFVNLERQGRMLATRRLVVTR
jgi:hypothetical protein